MRRHASEHRHVEASLTLGVLSPSWIFLSSSFFLPGRFAWHGSLRGATSIYNEHSRDWLVPQGSGRARQHTDAQGMGGSRGKGQGRAEAECQSLGASGRRPEAADSHERHDRLRMGLHCRSWTKRRRPQHDTRYDDAASRVLALCARTSVSLSWLLSLPDRPDPAPGPDRVVPVYLHPHTPPTPPQGNLLRAVEVVWQASYSCLVLVCGSEHPAASGLSWLGGH